MMVQSEVYIPKVLCPLIEITRTENELLFLKLTCRKNLTEIVIKSVDLVNCINYIHFMVSAPLF